MAKLYYIPPNKFMDSCWHLKRLGVFAAWQHTRGDGVVICHTDPEGLLFHPTMDDANIVKRWGYSAGEADTHTVNSVVYPAGYDKEITGTNFWMASHGTECASICISPSGAEGFAGIAHESDMLFGRDSNFGTYTPVYGSDANSESINSFVQWAVANNCNIMNSSTTSWYSFNIPDFTNYYINDDLIFVQPVGNGGGNVSGYGTKAGTILVGGFDKFDERYVNDFYPERSSNYGSNVDFIMPAEYVTVAAPGVAGDPVELSILDNNHYQYFGTSYAGPIMMGVLALIKSANTSLTAAQVIQVARDATDILTGSTVYNYFPSNVGMCNAHKAVLIAKSLDANNDGIIFPYIDFGIANTQLQIKYGEARLKLSGMVTVEVGGYIYNDEVTGVTVTTSFGDVLYTGAPNSFTFDADDYSFHSLILEVSTETDTVTVEYEDVGNTDSYHHSITADNLFTITPSNDPLYGVAEWMRGWPIFQASVTHAWKYTRGDPNVAIAHVDAGSSALLELIGRLHELTEPDDGYSLPDHGTAGMMAMGARDDSPNGVVGPSQLNPLICRLAENSNVADYLGEFNVCLEAGAKATCIVSWASYDTPAQRTLIDEIYATHAAHDAVLCMWGGNFANNENVPVDSTIPVNTGLATGVSVDLGEGLAQVKDPWYHAPLVVGGIAPNGMRCGTFGRNIDILSPYIQYLNRVGEAEGGPVAGYGWIGGTSFATPFATGVVSLVRAANPSLSYSVVINLIKTHSDKYYYPFATQFYNEDVGTINAAKPVLAALSLVPSNAGRIYPYIRFFGQQGSSCGVESSGVWYEKLNGQIVTKLHGSIFCEIKGYSSDPITSIELWAGNSRIFIGSIEDAEIVGLQANSATGERSLLTVVVSTSSDSVSVTYSDIFVNSLNTLIDNAPPIVTFSLPATTSIVTVAPTEFTANDSFGVNGYYLSESNIPPPEDSLLWASSPQTFITLSSGFGLKTVYAYARDTSNNIGVASAQTTVTDAQQPEIVAFSGQAVWYAYSNYPVYSIVGDDNYSIEANLKYLVTKNANIPIVGNSGWTLGTPSVSLSPGANLLYPWAKDEADKISPLYGNPLPVTMVISAAKSAPTINVFTVPSVSSGYTVSIVVSATGSPTAYIVTEDNNMPRLTAAGWSTTPPINYTFDSTGSKTLYAWARNADGYVSMSAAKSVEVRYLYSSPPEGAYAVNQLVALGCVDQSATIYYNTGDGTQPDPTVSTGTIYTAAIQISAATVIKFFARDSLLNDSPVQAVTYVISLAAITINPVATVTVATATITGTMSESNIISGISGATFGALTYPTATTWSLAVSNLVVGSNSVKVRATAPNYSFSEATVVITRTAPPDGTAPTTTASPAGNTYTTAQTVTLNNSESAPVYYTTDGTNPTYPASGNTQVATSPVQVTIPATGVTSLRYRSRDAAGNLEVVKIQTYTINPPVIPDPVLSVPNPTFDASSVLFRIAVANRLSGDTCVFQYQNGAVWTDIAGGSLWVSTQFEKLVSRSTLPQTSLPTRAIVTRNATTFYSNVVSIDLTATVTEPGIHAVMMPHGVELLTTYPPTDNEALRIKTLGGLEVGLKLGAARDDAIGAIRVKKSGTEYSVMR